MGITIFKISEVYRSGQVKPTTTKNSTYSTLRVEFADMLQKGFITCSPKHQMELYYTSQVSDFLQLLSNLEIGK